jgi:glycine oxidase
MHKDIVVIGGGIIGLSVALAIADCGKSVTIYAGPPQPEGMATTAAGAMLGAVGEISLEKAGPRADSELRMRIEAQRMYPRWLARVVPDVFQRANNSGSGTFIVGNRFGRRDGETIALMEERARFFGLPFERRTPLGETWYYPAPNYRATDGIFLPDESWVNPEFLHQRLTDILTTNPYCSIFWSSIDSMTVEGPDSVLLMDSEGTSIHATKVVIAAGIGSDPLLEALPFPVSRVMSGKGSSLIIRTPVEFPCVVRSPNRDFACGVHIVPRGAARYYVGATNRVMNVPGGTRGVSVEEVHDLLHEIMHEFNTTLDGASIERMSYGSRPATYDGYPLIGPTEHPSVLVATGTYRNGILLAPLIAEIMRSAILEEPPIIHNPFLPTRERVHGTTLGGGLIKAGSEAIVSFLTQPHGSLPYNRAQELGVFVEKLLGWAFSDNESLREERELWRQRLMSAPIPETFAQLFFSSADGG